MRPGISPQLEEDQLRRVSAVLILIVVALVAMVMYVFESQSFKIGFLLVAILLWFVPLLLEPRLAMVGAKIGHRGPIDTEFESRFFRASWYSYNLLLAVVFGYFTINASTAVTVPLWVLGYTVVGSAASYWVILWWID